MEKHKKEKKKGGGKEEEKKINTSCLRFNQNVTVNRFMKPPASKSTIAPTTAEEAPF